MAKTTFKNGIAWDAIIPHIVVTLIAGFFICQMTFSWVAVILAAVMYFITACLGITLCYHRLLTHKAFKTYGWVRNLLAVCGALAWQYDPIKWVGTHRIHHDHSDEKDDPHTPLQDVSHMKKGTRWLGRIYWFLHAHIMWTWEKSSREENKEILRVTRDLRKIPFMMWLKKYYGAVNAVGIVLFFAIGFLFGIQGGFAEGLRVGVSVIVWQAVRIVIVYTMTFAINSWTHVIGYRLYESGDNSRNSFGLILASFGEALHNIHHAFQNTAKNSSRWWEIDLTWWIIRMMQTIGLAWDVYVPSREALAAKRIRSGTSM